MATNNDDLMKKMLDIESMVKKTTPTETKQPYFDEVLRGQRVTDGKMDEVIKMATTTNNIASAISTKISGVVNIEKPVPDIEEGFYKEMWSGLYKRLDGIESKLGALPLEKDTNEKLTKFFDSVKNEMAKPTISNLNVGALQNSVTNIEKYVGSLETIVAGVATINESLKQPTTDSGVSPEMITKMTDAIATLQASNQDNENLQQIKTTLQNIEAAQKEAQQFPPEMMAALNKLAEINFGSDKGQMQEQIDQLRKLEAVDTQILERLMALDFKVVKEAIDKTNLILKQASEIKAVSTNELTKQPDTTTNDGALGEIQRVSANELTKQPDTINDGALDAFKKMDFAPLQELKGLSELIKTALPQLKTLQQTKPETANLVNKITEPKTDLISKSFDEFSKFDFTKITQAFAPFESLTKLNLEPLSKLDDFGTDITKTITDLGKVNPFDFKEIQASLAAPLEKVAQAPLADMIKPVLPQIDDMVLPLTNQREQRDATVTLSKLIPMLTDMVASKVPSIFTPATPVSDAVNPMAKNAETFVKPEPAAITTEAIKNNPFVEITKVETPSITDTKTPNDISPDVAALIQSQKELMDRMTMPVATSEPEKKEEDPSTNKAEATTAAPKKVDTQDQMVTLLQQVVQSNEALVRLMTQGRFNKNTGL